MDFVSTLTNTATINIGSGQKLRLGTGQTFNQNGGTVAGLGGLDFTGSTFNFNAGTIAGTGSSALTTCTVNGAAPVLINSTLNFGSSTGSASFIQTGGSSKATGTIAPAQTLWVSGRAAGSHTTLTLANGLTNAGAIRLESADSTYQSQITITGGTLTNTGTMDVNLGSGGTRVINGAFDNQGTLNINFTLDFISTMTNSGTVNIASGQKLRLASGQTFNHNGGTIAGTGILELTGATLNFNGGTTTGSTPQLINGTLNFGNASTAAIFNMTGGSGKISGNIPAGATLWINGRGAGSHTTVTAAVGFTNAGTIDVATGSGGTRAIAAIVVNNGLMHINTGLTVTGTSFDNGAAGVIDGNGVVTLGTTTFRNGGQLNPGSSPAVF